MWRAASAGRRSGGRLLRLRRQPHAAPARPRSVALVEGAAPSRSMPCSKGLASPWAFRDGRSCRRGCRLWRIRQEPQDWRAGRHRPNWLGHRRTQPAMARRREPSIATSRTTAATPIRKWRRYWSYRRETGIAPRPTDDREVLERCLYAMVNSCTHLERRGLQAVDIRRHLAARLRLPAYHDGPMFWADQVGLGKIHDLRLWRCASQDQRAAPGHRPAGAAAGESRARPFALAVTLRRSHLP